MALPSSAVEGTLRIYNLLAAGGNVLCELAAHKSPVVRLPLLPDMGNGSNRAASVGLLLLLDMAKGRAYVDATASPYMRCITCFPVWHMMRACMPRRALPPACFERHAVAPACARRR